CTDRIGAAGRVRHRRRQRPRAAFFRQRTRDRLRRRPAGLPRPWRPAPAPAPDRARWRRRAPGRRLRAGAGRPRCGTTPAPGAGSAGRRIARGPLRVSRPRRPATAGPVAIALAGGRSPAVAGAHQHHRARWRCLAAIAGGVAAGGTLRHAGGIAMMRARGAAFLLVLWLVTLLAALAGTFALAARTEHLQGQVLARGLEAREAARAGLEYAVVRAAAADPRFRWTADGSEHAWQFGDAEVTVRIVDEQGKVDLNMADAGLLSALMQQLGLDDRTAM